LVLGNGFQLCGDKSIGSSVDLKKVSFVLNYNLDLSGRIDPLDKFSLQAKLNLGDRGRLAEQTRIDELYLNGLEAYAEGDLEEAIDFWEHVLEIDPSYTPARANIETAQKALEQQSDMEEQLRIGN
jgi:tetratricopeptide (TPR) repeat protein